MLERALPVRGVQVSRDTRLVAGPVDRGPARAGLRSRIARDAAAAVGWAALGCALAELALGPVAAQLALPISPRQRLVVLGLVMLQSVALALRRVRPVTCLLVVALLQALIGAALPDQTMLRAGPTLVAAYTVGTCLTRRRLAALVGAAALEVAAPSVLGVWLTPEVKTGVLQTSGGGPGALPGAVGWTLLVTNVVLAYATPVLVGLVIAARRTRIQLLEDRAAATASEQEAREAVAVSAERTRMARELHSIAAHHLSGMVVQAAAAERLVERDPQTARSAIATVRAEGREALSSLRSMVGVLRDPGLGPDELRDPVPGLAGLPALIDHARARGESLELVEDGGPRPLSSVADAAAYRVLQEGLANARQHAPDQPVSILLRQTSTDFVLRIENALAPFGGPDRGRRPGFGLLGMTERAGLAGGAVAAGPVDGSRWRVELTIPNVAEPGEARTSGPGPGDTR